MATGKPKKNDCRGSRWAWVDLDPSQRAEVRQLIKGLAGQHTVILSTHLLSEVTVTCERVLIINQGRMVAFDEIRNLAHALGQGDQTSLEDIFLKLTAAA